MEVNTKDNMNCPLCYKKIYSEAGTGCKMCGMALEFLNEGFCSDIYKKEYKKINKPNNLNKSKQKEVIKNEKT